ncbi:secretory pathway protein Ssp120 [Pseudohyphozyma bogoriensis]|nr:secretory pathway protein Ssp120 [Pseudohyphozyma bogoriensis]
MAQEHHFDSFDLSAFFHLHDLNRDGILDVNELESIYGVHHEKLKKATGDVEVHTQQAKEIVQKVLEKLDTNGDGVLTLREFNAGGVGGLPNFKGVEHLGHHYDAEGEYFLHHEEKYHNTPETQNEEDYIHPEDIEHFMQHEQIEAEEAERVREFQGITEEEEAAQFAAAEASAAAAQQARIFDNTPPEDPNTRDAIPSPPVPEQRIVNPPSPEEEARRERAAFAKAQAAKFGKDAREASKRGEWGSAPGAEFKRPKDDADRLRKAVPYKSDVPPLTPEYLVEGMPSVRFELPPPPPPSYSPPSASDDDSQTMNPTNRPTEAHLSNYRARVLVDDQPAPLFSMHSKGDFVHCYFESIDGATVAVEYWEDGEERRSSDEAAFVAVSVDGIKKLVTQNVAMPRTVGSGSKGCLMGTSDDPLIFGPMHSNGDYPRTPLEARLTLKFLEGMEKCPTKSGKYYLPQLPAMNHRGLRHQIYCRNPTYVHESVTKMMPDMIKAQFIFFYLPKGKTFVGAELLIKEGHATRRILHVNSH